jgi:hypothetical protein
MRGARRRKLDAILRPIAGPTIVSAIALTIILSFAFKHFVPGSTWRYSILSAALVIIGLGLCSLATAIVLGDASQ